MELRFSNPRTSMLATFVRNVGIAIEPAVLPEVTFLPCLEIRGGVVRIDEERLLYPGDILHEAGHVAVSDPVTRHSPEFTSTDAGEEMAAIAWSYAAACALGVAPDIVFHPQGYKGGADALVENFTSGRYIGVPLLQWWGMTVEPHKAHAQGVASYPHMLRWLR
jgi:hypothetical protein